MTRVLQRKIHVGCKQLGLCSDARHDLQLRVTGKASMSDMTEAELQMVVDALREAGFKPASKTGSKGFKPASRSDLKYVHVLWRLLGQAGKLDKPDRAGLNAFVRAQFEEKWGHIPMDIDALRDAGEIRDVIEALKAWCRWSGVELDRR